MNSDLFQALFSFLRNPNKAFQSIKEEAMEWPILVSLILISSLTFWFSTIAPSYNLWGNLKLLALIIPVNTAWLAVWTLAMRVSSRILGQKTEYLLLFRVVIWSQAPLIFIVLIHALYMLFSEFLPGSSIDEIFSEILSWGEFGVYFWSLFLSITGVNIAGSMDLDRSVVTHLLGFVLLVSATLVLFIVIFIVTAIYMFSGGPMPQIPEIEQWNPPGKWI